MVELYYEKYRADTGFDVEDAAVIWKRGLRDNDDGKENARRARSRIYQSHDQVRKGIAWAWPPGCQNDLFRRYDSCPITGYSHSG